MLHLFSCTCQTNKKTHFSTFEVTNRFIGDVLAHKDEKEMF